MKEIKIKLLEEELETLNKGNGKEVSIFESEDRNIKIIISYSKD